ncbi:hypothetical protein ACOSP7_024035 [Xanthoceras sorbifolium]
MIPVDFFAYGSVLVQGHPVTLTPKLVNEYFQVPNFPEPVGGWVEHEFFQMHNWDLAGSLRADEESRRWNVPGDAPAADDEMEVEQDQDISQQGAALHDHEQHQAIAEIRASFKGRMEGMKARRNISLDVVEAGMIGIESRLNTRMAAMVARMDKIYKTLNQMYGRRQAGPS